MSIFSVGGGNAAGYDIEQSLRFDDGDSAYLSRTPSSTGNRKTWTWSGWVKRGIVDHQELWAAYTSNNDAGEFNFMFKSDEVLEVSLDTTVLLKTNQVFRDVGAWYHIVLMMDTANSTAGDRIAIYVNGSRIPSSEYSVESFPSLNQELAINRTCAHYLGRDGSAARRYFDGYLAEVHFIDGTALDASSFGETNADTNQWVPIEYAGSYGTNGFYLKFQDSAALGDDSSGNTNDFSATNLVATDQVIDSPTNNFATYNPLVRSSSNSNYSEGNLYATDNGGGNWEVRLGTIPLPETGKWYWECRVGNGNAYIGILDEGEDITVTNPTGGVVWYGDDGRKRIDGTFSSYGASYGGANVLGVAVDMDASPRTITFYKDNTTQGSITITGDCATGTVIPYITSIVQTWINFGQDSSFAGSKTAQGNTDGNGKGDFYYTPPSGFLALCTDNLDDPSIADPTAHFNTLLFVGDGASSRSVTGVGFAPDASWLKNRGPATSHHFLMDSVRGDGLNIQPSKPDVEAVHATQIKTLDSDGFTVGSGNCNTNGNNIVSWNWKAGGTASSNSDGTITSSVSANTDAGFSIVSYTSPGTNVDETIGHGLSQAPELVITKNRDAITHWDSWVSGLSSTYSLLLNETDPQLSSRWSATIPSASLVTLRDSYEVNGTDDYIAYCFHGVDGYSKVGSYSGNSSDDGVFIYTGFKPAFVLIKCYAGHSGQEWVLLDNKRPEYNVVNKFLYANASDAEGSNSRNVDFVSNGIKMRSGGTGGTGGPVNITGRDYIYLAFAESPFKTSNAR